MATDVNLSCGRLVHYYRSSSYAPREISVLRLHRTLFDSCVSCQLIQANNFSSLQIVFSTERKKLLTNEPRLRHDRFIGRDLINVRTAWVHGLQGYRMLFVFMVSIYLHYCFLGKFSAIATLRSRTKSRTIFFFVDRTSSQPNFRSLSFFLVSILATFLRLPPAFSLTASVALRLHLAIKDFF